MTELQARVLYTAVQQGKQQAMLVPSAKELVKLLPHAQKMGVRGLTEHLKRLNTSHECFFKQGKQWAVNREMLVTEPESATYLLCLVEKCHSDPEARVSKEELHATVLALLGLSADWAEDTLQKAKNAQYVEQTNTFLRIGKRTAEQLPYIKLVAGPLTVTAPATKGKKR